MTDKELIKEVVNIYGEDSKRMTECYNERIAVFNSIRKGITAEEELKMFFEIGKLDFHLIPYNDHKGEKHLFLRGFLKGLDWGLKIVANRSKNINEQADFSASLDYYS